MSQYVDIDISDEVGFTLDARVDDECRPIPRDVPRWKSLLCPLKGQDVRITVVRAKLRTPKANAYLWSAVYPFLLDGLRELALNAGEACPFKDKKKLHVAMKHRFRDVLGTAVTVFLGEEFPDEPTTRVPGPIFARYIEHMSAWAAHRGIYLPQPGEYGLKLEAIE